MVHWSREWVQRVVLLFKINTKSSIYNAYNIPMSCKNYVAAFNHVINH